MGDNSGRKKKSAPRSAKPTYVQLVAKLESLDTVQARIDCIAADLKSKKNHYDCLGWGEILEFVGLSPGNEACWGSTKYGWRGHEPAFDELSKPIAESMPGWESDLPTDIYLALEREAATVLEAEGPTDLTTNKIVEVLREFSDKKLSQCGIIVSDWQDDFENETRTEEIEEWVDDVLLEQLEERYYEFVNEEAHPSDWRPSEDAVQFGVCSTSLDASDGTCLFFEAMIGCNGEITEPRTPYDLEAGNGIDLSGYVEVDS
jgi:hypothetical protein